MVFCSSVFLFVFLPLVLLTYLLAPRGCRNYVLLLASLLFYAWGEPGCVMLMLGSIAGNYLAGRLLELAIDRPRLSKVLLALAIAANLGALAAYKYANFLADNLNIVLAWLDLPGVRLKPVHLPIGISFFTFHAMSFLIDLHRRKVTVPRNPFDFALYIALFPQLVAGPIVRYCDIAAQIASRRVTRRKFALGIKRFIIGLGKKMILANTAALTADQIFTLPAGDLSFSLAWLGIVCFTLQIYFDFSGYSDMAIGLGKIFGFDFLENFNYPYIASSITEFWRRWHISLSTWYRDYLYIPLGGNRCPAWRMYGNLLLVFFLCGLWHGASWTFIVWGLFHGLFLLIERLGLSRLLALAWTPLRHAYVLLAVMIGWVFFKADSLTAAGTFLQAMAGLGASDSPLHSLRDYLTPELKLVLIVSAVACLPVLPVLERWFAARVASAGESRRWAGVLEVGYHFAGQLALGVIFICSAMYLAAGTYNPFIYYRF